MTRNNRRNRPSPGLQDLLATAWASIDGSSQDEARTGAAAQIGRAIGRVIGFLNVSLFGWRLLFRRLRTRFAPRDLAKRYLVGVSNGLIVFGGVLLVLGILIRVSREVSLSAAERRPTPEFSAISPPGPTEPAAVVDAATPIGPRRAPERIVIPSLNMDVRIKNVGWTRVMNGDNPANVWETANYAAGFHDTSALPGMPGNTVISGHNNILGSVFRDLHKMEPGQKVYVYTGDVQHVYEVQESFIVQEEGATPDQRHANARWIAPTDDERLTLVSCYPPWSNTHRSIVVARPIDAEPLPPDSSSLPTR